MMIKDVKNAAVTVAKVQNLYKDLFLTHRFEYLTVGDLDSIGEYLDELNDFKELLEKIGKEVEKKLPTKEKKSA